MNPQVLCTELADIIKNHNYFRNPEEAIKLIPQIETQINCSWIALLNEAYFGVKTKFGFAISKKFLNLILHNHTAISIVSTYLMED